MQEIRMQVLEMMKALGLTQAEVVKRLNKTCSYRVNAPDFNRALHGKLTTPKANRMLVDALNVCNKEKRRVDRIAARAAKYMEDGK